MENINIPSRNQTTNEGSDKPANTCKKAPISMQRCTDNSMTDVFLGIRTTSFIMFLPLPHSFAGIEFFPLSHMYSN